MGMRSGGSRRQSGRQRRSPMQARHVVCFVPPEVKEVKYIYTVGKLNVASGPAHQISSQPITATLRTLFPSPPSLR